MVDGGPPAPQTPLVPLAPPAVPPTPPAQPSVPSAQPGPAPPLNWSHFKPEFSGKPDKDAKSPLLTTND